MEKQIKQTSFKLNFLLNTFLQLINIISPLLTAPYVSRILGVEQIGIYSYVYSINYYFVMVASLGTATYGIIEIAKVRDDEVARSKCFWGIEIITILTSTLCIITWIIGSMISKSYSNIMLAMTFNLIAVVFDISWFYIGIEKVKYTVFINAFFKLLGVVLIFMLVNTSDDLILYVIILSITMFIGNVSMWMFLKQFVCKCKVKLEELKHHFRGTMIYFIPTVATSVYTVLDKTLIGVITHDTAENGYYEQATKIISLIKTVSFTSLSTLLGSRMTYMFVQNNVEEISKKRDFAINFVVFVGIGACFGLLGISCNFVPIFFGDEYVEASDFLMLMSPLLPIMGISNLIGNLYYNPTGQRKKSTVLLVIGCLVNVVLNIILIPLWAGKGAIIGTLIAEMLITYLYVYYSKKFVTFQMIFKVLWKKIISGTLMLAYIMMISKTLENGITLLIVQCIGGLIIYLITLLVLRDVFVTTYFNKVLGKFKGKYEV